MLLGNVRASLTRDDAQIALRLLAHGESRELDRGEQRLREEGIDALLDDPRLLPSIIESRIGMQVSVRLFWYVVVRNDPLGFALSFKLICDLDVIRWLVKIFVKFCVTKLL